MRIFLRILTGIFALVFCAVALVSVVGAVALTSVEHMFTREAMISITEKADMDAILQSILSSQGENLLTQAATSEPVKDIVVEYFAGYGEYLLTGQSSFTVTEEQKQALLDVVLEVLTGSVGTMDESSAKLLRMQTQATLEGMLTQYIPPYSELDIGIPNSALEMLRTALSPMARGVLWGVVALALALIALVRFSWHEWLVWGGFTGLVAGGGMLTAHHLLNLAVESAATANKMANSLMTALFGEVQGMVQHYGIWITASSAVMVVLFFVIRALIHRRRNRLAAEAAA